MSQKFIKPIVIILATIGLVPIAYWLEKAKLILRHEASATFEITRLLWFWSGAGLLIATLAMLLYHYSETIKNRLAKLLVTIVFLSVGTSLICYTQIIFSPLNPKFSSIYLGPETFSFTLGAMFSAFGLFNAIDLWRNRKNKILE